MTVTTPKLPLVFAIFAAVLVAIPLAHAGTAGVQDNAGFFSDAAEADANWNIRDVQKTLRKDVCVETFAELPANLRQNVNVQDKTAMNRLFDQWAVQRAREQSVNGVYILLVKQPSHLQVVVGNDTQKQAFTLADRDQLVRTMLAKLRAKDFDGALREGVTFVASTMKSHAGVLAKGQPAADTRRSAPPASSSGGGSGWLLPLIVLGIVAWLAFRLIGSLFGRGRSMTPGDAGTPMAGGPAGGGGFGRSLLGGLFGGAAGMWMYDHFFGGGGSSAHGAPPESRDGIGDGGGGHAPFTGQDTDYSSSGSDFGGGSASGGGGGGGDFGGGDSGGGGDF